MDMISATAAFAALAQDTRLAVFRTLVAHEPTGLPAGEIARSLAVPHNTMSSHLAVLERAALVTSTRRGRSIIYRADLTSLSRLLVYLLKDCCGGRHELCRPLIAELTPCCTPETACG